MLAVLALLLIACGPSQPAEIEATATSVPDTPEISEAPTSVPEVAESSSDAEPETAPAEPVTSDLQYLEVEAGDGPMPAAGDRVLVHYTGTLEDGTVFDSSLPRGTPFEFVLGRGQVIRGWDEGIALMREGGKATLIIPPNLAYGATGAGDTIPPNATLTFEVELVSVFKPPTMAEVAEEDLISLPSGIQYHDLELGAGTTITEGDRVSIHFAVWTVEGDFLTDSREQGQPAIYTLGTRQLFLNDWDEGVIGMQVGGLRQLIISPDVDSSVTTGQTLVLEMEMVQRIEPIAFADVDEEDYTTTDSGLQYYDIVEGSGEEAGDGFTVTVQYTGWLLGSEVQFDSSLERDDPVEFPLGTGVVIPGWDEGINGMRVGGRRQLVIPPDLAFGEGGAGRVPPNATLMFEVELIAVSAGT
jgi:peptidylprolyl isomerase